MVALTIVKEANASLKTSLPAGQVALIVGGTGGLGAAVAKELAHDLQSPKIYLLGRNQESATRIIDELKAINEQGQYEFIKADVSLLKNVREATTEFAKKEKKLNMLVLSSGVLGMDARKPTSEDIDVKMATNYYSRMLFIKDLLPSLQKAAENNGQARVLAILGGGQEGKIVESDLSLSDPKNYSIGNLMAHTGTLTTFSFEKFAEENKGVSFVHTYPGIVDTGILSGMPLPVRMLATIFSPILKMFVMVPVPESGARNVYHLTSSRYPSASLASSLDLKEVAKGSRGVVGSGSYLVNWNGETAGDQKLLEDFRERKVKEKIWDDLNSTHDRVLKA